MLTVYCWLLCLYPRSYRHEFGDEMTSVFHDARIELPPALAAKVSFYGREFCGLLSGALCAHFDRVFGPAISFPRFHMQREFSFPRSTLLLMCVILRYSQPIGRSAPHLLAIIRCFFLFHYNHFNRYPDLD